MTFGRHDVHAPQRRRKASKVNSRVLSAIAERAEADPTAKAGS